jgi:hypothetical protein
LFGHNRKRQMEQSGTNRNVKLLLWMQFGRGTYLISNLKRKKGETSYYLLKTIKSIETAGSAESETMQVVVFEF